MQVSLKGVKVYKLIMDKLMFQKTLIVFVYTRLSEKAHVDEIIEQAGAELCQAKHSLS